MLYRIWWILLVPLIRLYWRVSVHGRDNIQGFRGMIIASNHQSGIDPILVCAAFWRHVFWLAKIELVITRKIAWFFKSVAVIPVDRNAPKDASLRDAADHVQRGKIFGIFPEGTRGPDGRIYKGHTGVARIAEISKGPVIPTAVVGSLEACPKGKILARPRKCRVIFGTPMHFDIRQDESPEHAYRRFTDEVMEAIARLKETGYVRDVYSSEARKRASV